MPGGQAPSDSPFGAYVPPPGEASPLQTPPKPLRPPPPGRLNLAGKETRRGGGGLIALVVVLVVAIGGAGFAFTQNWFGLLGPAPIPDEQIDVAGPVDKPETPGVQPSTPGDKGESILVPDDVANQKPPIEPATNDQGPTETTPSDAGPDDTQIIVDPPFNDTPQTPGDVEVAVADGPKGSVIPPLEGVPAMLAWVKSYRLDSCQFAQALAADERSMTIEAFGTEVPPFEALMNSFKAEHGIEPDIFMRVATEPQCSAVDFLRFVEPLAETGPVLNVDSTDIARGGRLAGNLQGTSGWKTDLLLVDDAGVVHKVATAGSTSGATATFATAVASSARESVPMILLAISSRAGLTVPASADGKPASTVFPAILREMQQSSTNVAVGVKYMKLGAR
jgi:serine/threonine-protein kinase